MIKTRYATYASSLSTLGYDTTPLRGKIPIMKGWQTRPRHDHSEYGDSNIGVICGGAHNIVGIDIDCKDATTTTTLREMVEDQLGFAPERVGNVPKTLFVFRCTEPFHKIKTGVYEIDGQDAAVEVLAEGQQFCASGPHPVTGKNYEWIGDSLLDIPAMRLTPISPSDLTCFIAECNNLLANVGSLKAKSMSAGGRHDFNFTFAENCRISDIRTITDAIECIPNDDIHYDDWVRVGFAIKGAVGDEGRELFDRWSQRSIKYDLTKTDRLWASIGNVERIGAGTIYHLAKLHGYKHRSDEFGPGDHKEDKRDTKSESFQTEENDDSFTAASVAGPIPKREWLLDKWFPTGTTAMLFGAGGVGKSLLMHQLANCVASGRPFLGVATKQMPALCVFCEDDALELKRRQLDINRWMGVDEFGSGPENLTLWPRIGSDNILITFPGQGEDKAGDFFEKLCAKISQVKGAADGVLVILDTAADLFGGNENIRREVNTFIKTYLGSISIKFNATVVLLAHPSLSGLASGSGMSGSTAWENSVRSRAYLARTDGSEELRVLSRKKSNYSSVGAYNDITLIWDGGILTVPATLDQLDRVNSVEIKELILSEVESAWRDGAPYRSHNSSGRKVNLALPKTLRNYSPAVLMKAFHDLVLEGNIAHEERKGYRVEKGLKGG